MAAAAGGDAADVGPAVQTGALLDSVGLSRLRLPTQAHLVSLKSGLLELKGCFSQDGEGDAIGDLGVRVVREHRQEVVPRGEIGQVEVHAARGGAIEVE